MDPGSREENTSKIKAKEGLDRQRLDKWLWHARVVKARTSAAALVEAGHVRINGVREKSPGHAVKAGDVLTVGLDRTVRVLKVTGFSERRGDAASARVLYEDLQKPVLQESRLQESRLQESGSKESDLKKPRE